MLRKRVRTVMDYWRFEKLHTHHSKGGVQYILKFDKTDPYQVRIYFEKLIRSLLSTGFKMKNQIIFSGDQNFQEFIDYGSGSMGILLTLKKIIDNQEFDPIFKDL